MEEAFNYVDVHTLCPKVRVTSKPTLFSVNSGWILKSFDVLIAQCFRFDLVYDTWWLLHKGTWDNGLHFRHILKHFFCTMRISRKPIVGFLRS